MFSSNHTLCDLDLSGFVPPLKPLPKVPGVEKIESTDWNWMLARANESGHKRGVADMLDYWNKSREKKWGKDKWTRVVQKMKSFEHKYFYQITPEEIQEAMKRSGSVLGSTTNLDRTHGNIHDASAPVPFTLMLHSLMEELKRVPTWEEFKTYHLDHPGVFLRYAAEKANVPLDLLLDKEWLNHPVSRAVRYRLGNVYNSTMREFDFAAKMREWHGIHLTHHFLLDAVWKIDFLYGAVAVELFLNNPFFKETIAKNSPKCDHGRKLLAHEMNPGRDILVVAFDVRKEGKTYNQPWLIKDEQINAAAERLLSGDVDFRRRPTFFS